MAKAPVASGPGGTATTNEVSALSSQSWHIPCLCGYTQKAHSIHISTETGPATCLWQRGVGHAAVQIPQNRIQNARSLAPELCKTASPVLGQLVSLFWASLCNALGILASSSHVTLSLAVQVQQSLWSPCKVSVSFVTQSSVLPKEHQQSSAANSLTGFAVTATGIARYLSKHPTFELAKKGGVAQRKQ